MILTAARYLLYRIFAPHRKGFGIHSPFVFHLVTGVFIKKDDEKLSRIKKMRGQLSGDKSVIATTDAGAGSRTHGSGERTVSSINRKSSIPHKYGRILYYLAMEFKPGTVIELGTGLGISTLYLAAAGEGSRVFTVDLDGEKSYFASRLAERSGFSHIRFVKGTFAEELPALLESTTHPLLVYIDGDHTGKNTLGYYNMIKKYAAGDSVMVFDDIRWSRSMKDAWDAIRMDPDTVISIDLFFMGIVFFRPGITKQDFVINF